jgi:hypothetical protein
MKLTSHAYHLSQAFDQPGCPICRLTADSVHHYLEALMYEYVNKPLTHVAVRAARGFCPTHAWHVLERINASALGIAILYEGLVRNMLKDMGEITPDSGRRQVTQATSAIKSRKACPACTHRATIEHHLLRNLLEHVTQEEFANGFRQSAGLCLPHLRQALDQQGAVAAKALLITIQQDIWSQLQRDLAEFVRKNDYRLIREEMGDEGTSPRRVIEQMSGVKDLR